jgi:hypothetical protein
MTLLTQSATEPEVVHPTERKLWSYLRREDGWHYGEGIAFHQDAVDAAVKLHRFVLENGFYRTNAFPGLGGQVVVTLYHGLEYYEFAIQPDHTVALTREIDGQEITYREPLSIDGAYTVIRKIRTDAWISSESLGESTMILTSAGSRAGCSAILAAVAESLSSIGSAWPRPVAAYAGTSRSIMPTSEETIQSSGTCPRLTCLMTAN